MITPTFVLLALLAASKVQAKNDWSVPCTSGACEYDLPTGSLAAGTLKIWGSEDAITDITKAADWEILGCDPKALAQDIRLVCKTDPNDPNSKCAHLYQNIGAVDKIVRLPENCGASAFARVSKAWVPEDQSIPSDVAKRLVRRAGVPPVVKALHIDTNWDAVKWSKTGQVNIAIVGGNHAGAPTSVQTGSKVRRVTGRKQRRFGFGDVVNGVKDAAGAVKDGVEDAAGKVADGAEAAKDAVTSVAVDAATKVADKATEAATAVKDTATKAAEGVKDGAEAAGDAVKDAATKAATAVKDAATAAASAVVDAANKTIDVSKGFDLPPIQFDKKGVNLINSAISCFGKSLTMNVDMDANADVLATLNVLAKGKLVPPSFSEFGVVAVMNGKIGGTLNIQADVSGFLDSGFIPLINIGIPGLDFPGILEVGPTFTVDANINGQMDISMDMSVGLQMDLNNATIAFPPDAKNAPKNGSFSLGDSPMTINAAPNVAFTGSIVGSLRPSLNLGVNALGGKGVAEVFLAMDASIINTLDLAASSATQKDKNGGATPVDGADGADGEETFVDEDGNPVDKDGNPLDADGNPIDAEETFVDEDGNPVDKDGNPLDADGNPIPTEDSTNNAAEGGAADGTADAAATDDAATEGDTAATQDDSAVTDDTEVTDDAAATDDTEAVDDAATDDTEVTDDAAAGDDAAATDETEVTDDTAAEDTAAEETSSAAAASKTAPAKATATAAPPPPAKDEKKDEGKDDGILDKIKDGAKTVVDGVKNGIDAIKGIFSRQDKAKADDATATDDAAAADDEETFVDEDGNPVDADGNPIEADTEATGDEETFVDEDGNPVDADGNPIADAPIDNAADGAAADGTEPVKGQTTTTDKNGDVTTKVDPTFGGCFNVAANLNVNVGLNGNLFGLFSAFKQKDLFNKDFQIFTKCFGDQAGTEDQFAAGGEVKDGISNTGKIVDKQSEAVADGTATEAAPAEGDAAPAQGDAPAEEKKTRRRALGTSRNITRRSTLQRRINLTCPLFNSRSGRLPLHTGTVPSASISTIASSVLI